MKFEVKIDKKQKLSKTKHPTRECWPEQTSQDLHTESPDLWTHSFKIYFCIATLWAEQTAGSFQKSLVHLFFRGTPPSAGPFQSKTQTTQTKLARKKDLHARGSNVPVQI